MTGWSRATSGKPVHGTRKVRTPRRRVAGNTRPPRGEDQCHRDEPAGRATGRAWSETGKLYLEQGQIGEHARAQARQGCVASLSGRPLEVAGNRRRRWMTVPAVRPRDRTRLTGRLAGF